MSKAQKNIVNKNISSFTSTRMGFGHSKTSPATNGSCGPRCHIIVLCYFHGDCNMCMYLKLVKGMHSHSFGWGPTLLHTYDVQEQLPLLLQTHGMGRVPEAFLHFSPRWRGESLSWFNNKTQARRKQPKSMGHWGWMEWAEREREREKRRRVEGKERNSLKE